MIKNYFTIAWRNMMKNKTFISSIFSDEQRIKEIGVRKVLGASVTNIVTLLSKDLLKLVLFPSLWSMVNSEW